MPISLVEVYQLLSDIARQAQESEAKAQGLAQRVRELEAEQQRLRQELENERNSPRSKARITMRNYDMGVL